MPAATSSCTTSCPIRPSPITSATSPSCGSPRRTPCIAMDPTVPNAAWLAASPAGTGTYRFVGTQFSSPCSACSLPAQATRSPTLTSRTPAPTSSTTPHSE